MSLTASSRQVMGDQVKRAQRTMLFCKILCTVLFILAGCLVAFLAETGHEGFILLLIFAVAVVISALGHAYSTAERLIDTSLTSLQSFERIEKLR